MEEHHSVPEPFRTILLAAMGIGVILQLAGGIAAMVWLTERICDFAYKRGQHAKAFVDFLRHRDQIRRLYQAINDTQLRNVVLNALFGFRHEFHRDKVIIYGSEQSDDVAEKQLIDQIVRSIRQDILKASKK